LSLRGRKVDETRKNCIIKKCSRFVILKIRSRGTKLAGHVARMGESFIRAFWLGGLKKDAAIATPGIVEKYCHRELC
jgi:hypothetical protein